LKPAPLLDVAVYLSFFPHLVAGPIVRGSELLPQLREQPDPDALDATRAARLIGRGLIKKMIVANYLAQTLTTPVFGSPRSYRSWDLLIAAYAYSVQIYADFSGYTDIAIGVALLLGIKFPDNFNRPYTATTLQDFWRRWHMTLSRWLRDYLYIPLGGSHGGRRAMYRNLMITMVLGGLWHGASWNFVVWGVLHGAGLVVERRWVETSERPKHARAPTVERLRNRLGLETSHGEVPVVDDDAVTGPVPNPAQPWIARFVVFNFVTFAWIFFATNSLGDAFQFIGRLFTAWGATVGLQPLVLLVIAAALIAQYVPTRVGALLEWRASNLPPIVQGLAFGVLLLVCNVLGPQGVAPFIYFRF
jgi:D-alanyl-lipoteichoic acid acyltransferase DltB (MBOAT superfamily)